MQIIKENSPGTIAGLDDTHCFRQVVECDCWWRGSKPLLLSLGNRNSVLSMEDIDNWWSWSKWEGCMSQNIIYLCLKTWALAPLQIPASLYEGTIYLLLCWVITFSNKRQIWEHYCHPHALCLVNVGCIMTGSSLPWITMFSRCLNFGGDLRLCFAVSERASEIPLLSYYIMIVLTKCWHLRCLIIAR